MNKKLKCYRCAKEISDDIYYCSSCKKRLVRKINTRENIIVGIIIFILIASGISLMYFNWNKDIDENAFCLDKLNSVFPEYNFTKAEYEGYSSDIQNCIGYYNSDKLEKRDGLVEVSTINKEETKKFTLIDEYDKYYLDSDDISNTLIYLGFGLIGFGILIFWAWKVVD